jgi:hypothetical protein
MRDGVLSSRWVWGLWAEMGSRGVESLAGLDLGRKGPKGSSSREEGEWFQGCADGELGGWKSLEALEGWSENGPKEGGWH